jgi:LEA14-like dessication related protein
VSKISYNLDLNYQKKFVKGVSGQNIRIASIGYRNLELPVAFDFMDVLDPSDFFTHAEPVAYNLQGAISVGPYSLPFQASGTFETPQLLKARLKTLSVSKLSPLSASLLCTLEIENPNAFVFETASLEYELTLNQIRLIGGGITDIGRVEPSGKLDIHLPARPVFSGTEDPLYSALQLPITPYVLTGRMKIQGPGIGTRQFPFSESGEIILQK